MPDKAQTLMIGDVHQPISGFHQRANVRPRFEKNVPLDQTPLEPANHEPPQRTQRRTVSPQDLLTELETELNEAIEFAKSSPAQYEADLNEPPTTEKADAEKLVIRLQAELRDAQQKLAEINARPTPLRNFLGNALVIERSVQMLSQSIWEALTGLALFDTFKITDANRADPGVKKTMAQRWWKLANYKAWQSLARTLNLDNVSEARVRQSIERSAKTLEVIKAELEDSKE